MTEECASGATSQPSEVSKLDVPTTKLAPVSRAVVATQAASQYHNREPW
jgi:hypothetical protein